MHKRFLTRNYDIATSPLLSIILSHLNLAAELGPVLSARCRDRSVRRVRIPVSDAHVFRRFIANLIMSTPDAPVPTSPHDVPERFEIIGKTSHPGLKKIPPYWYPYTTMAKGRWLGREILEVVSTEFRDRSMEFYVRFLNYVSIW